MQVKNHSERTVIKLIVVVLAMFGFGYALVPLYDVICDVTGLNGKTGRISEAESAEQVADINRTIKIQFVASVNAGAPWDFYPNEYEMEVRPGGVYYTTFKAVNKTSHSLVGQAVPSLAPREAALYFNKTECFCFTQQSFTPNESRDMPVRFIVDRDLPVNIDSLVLSYTFFNITPDNQKS
ncbi:MAG: cytochrome c oxidase assembly protein [Gammaproteobacteria bacterium]|nr:cytochrome c oxidase assembly protein [Gammaproteobacteria bacterium]